MKGGIVIVYTAAALSGAWDVLWAQNAVRFVASKMNLSGEFAGPATGRVVVRGACQDPNLFAAVFYWDYLTKNKVCARNGAPFRLNLDLESSILNGELHFDYIVPKGESLLPLLKPQYDPDGEEAFKHYHESNFYFTFHRLSKLIEGPRFTLAGGKNANVRLEDYQHLNLKKLHEAYSDYLNQSTVYIVGQDGFGAEVFQIKNHDLWVENPCPCPVISNAKVNHQIVLLDSTAINNIGEFYQSLLTLTAYYIAYAETAANAGLQVVVTHSLFRFCNRYIFIYGRPDEIAYLRTYFEKFSPTVNEKTMQYLRLLIERLEGGLTPDAPFETLMCGTDFLHEIKKFQPVYEKSNKIAVL